MSQLPTAYKRVTVLSVDILTLMFSVWWAVVLRTGKVPEPTLSLIVGMVLAPLILIPIFFAARLYNTVIRYLTIHALARLCFCVSAGMLVWFCVVIGFLPNPLPRSASLIAWMSSVLGIVTSRLIGRYLIMRHTGELDEANAHNTVIFGAGAAGVQILWSLLHTTSAYRPIAFLDDDESLWGQEKGSLVIYSRSWLQHLIDKYEVSDVLFAIPSASRTERNNVIEWLETFPVIVRTLPSIDQIVSGEVRIDDITEIDVGDLLGRDPVPPVPELMARCIYGKSVMVTGAGGSIGSELCRQIIREKPRQLVLFELSEFALYTIKKEIHELCRELEHSVLLVDVIGTVQNRHLLSQTILHFEIQTLYHAAAYKHVPIVEHNMAEGIRNNIFGSLNVAQLSGELGVQHVVLISTDKAVRPTNVMGATKRVAEMILQGLDEQFTETVFSMVRFGNVLGSSGSVVPLFREQIRSGGPVTVTHRDITRYFMTITEAACLVIQAGAMADGGDVFVLDMGDPVNICHLAERMIRLSGLEPKLPGSDEGDIEIVFTGLRPGEKLFEELLIGGNVAGADHPKIMRAQEDCLGWPQLQSILVELKSAAALQDHGWMHRILARLVSGYRPKDCVVDHFSVHDGMPRVAEVVSLPVSKGDAVSTHPPFVD